MIEKGLVPESSARVSFGCPAGPVRAAIAAADRSAVTPGMAPWWAADPDAAPARMQSRRRQRARRAVAVGLAAAALLAAAFVAPAEGPRDLGSGIAQDPRTLDDLVAGCEGVVRWPVASGPAGWLPDDATHRYAGSPPTSGTFARAPLPAGFHDRAPEGASGAAALPRAVANLWRGQLVVWLGPGLGVAEREALRRILADRFPASAYVALPWPRELARRWGGGHRQVLLTGWGLSQGCEVASYDVVGAFAERVAGSGAPGQGTQAGVPGPRSPLA